MATTAAEGVPLLASGRSNNSESLSSASECSLTRQLTPPKNQKRADIRTLFRSVSSNSADSNQELLIMGEPRLSDIAPDLAAKHQAAARSNSVKSKTGENVGLANNYNNHCPNSPNRAK